MNIWNRRTQTFVARRDLYQETVINALRDDDLTITDNPLYLSYGGRNLEIDLGQNSRLALRKERVGLRWK